MVSIARSSDQEAMIDAVTGALSSRGARPAVAVLDEMGIGSLLAQGGNLLDAALVAEAAGRDGVIAFPDQPILVAAACVGMAQSAIDTAASYACERVVFGRPIGEYQGVAHKLADAVTEIDGTRLLIWRAIAARAEGLAEAGRLDVQAFWWTAKACLPAIKASMRVLGGYGVSEDSPLPSLYRAALAALYANGDPDLLLASAASDLPPIDAVSMSFSDDTEASTWEARTRAFLAEHFTQEHKRAFASSLDNHCSDLHQKLAAAGLLFPDWPQEWGGSGASAVARSGITSARIKPHP